MKKKYLCLLHFPAISFLAHIDKIYNWCTIHVHVMSYYKLRLENPNNYNRIILCENVTREYCFYTPINALHWLFFYLYRIHNFLLFTFFLTCWPPNSLTIMTFLTSSTFSAGSKIQLSSDLVSASLSTSSLTLHMHT